MRNYLVTITMADGRRGLHLGAYRDPSEAAGRASDLFPQASRIDVLREATARKRALARKPMNKEVSHGQR